MDTTKFQSSSEPSELEDFFLQKKIEVMIGITATKINNEINKVKETVLRINDEVSGVKKSLDELRHSISQPSANGVSLKSTDSTGHAVDKSSIKNKDTAPIAPRCGNYDLEDVSIEKFFYFGNRK